MVSATVAGNEKHAIIGVGVRRFHLTLMIERKALLILLMQNFIQLNYMVD